MVQMELDMHTAQLRMKIARLPGQVFCLSGIEPRTYRVHVNLARTGDHIELHSLDEF